MAVMILVCVCNWIVGDLEEWDWLVKAVNDCVVIYLHYKRTDDANEVIILFFVHWLREQKKVSFNLL